MEILHGIVVIVVVGGVLIALGLALVVSYFMIQVIWPAVVGAGGVYLLWMHVDQDIAVFFGFLSLAVQIWWILHTRKNRRDPFTHPPDSQNTYNQGRYNTPGYLDF